MRVAVIGAGYAGMAAAAELAAQGVAVEVFEAGRQLGGRARRVVVEGHALDNGAHLLVGAYRETLRLIDLVGGPRDGLRRQPLRLTMHGRFDLRAPRLPAPLHLAAALLTARGLTLAERLAAVCLMRELKRQHFRLARDGTVAELLAAQPERLRRLFWEPLCLASLNTPPEDASAQVFANVLRDTLGGPRAASDLLLPATDLSALFPEPAARFVESRGGRVRRASRIASLCGTREGFRLDNGETYAQVIIAVAPQHLAALIAPLPALAALAESMSALRWEPIVTCYLGYPSSVRLPQEMLGIDGGCAQWLFDRGRLCGQAGVIAAVISADGRHREMDAGTLAERIHGEIAAIVPGLPAPGWRRVITEKRATFACTPNLRRPPCATAIPGLWLAGDYVAGDYPATIEGAVRSGVAAARSVIEQAAAGKP